MSFIFVKSISFSQQEVKNLRDKQFVEIKKADISVKSLRL